MMAFARDYVMAAPKAERTPETLKSALITYAARTESEAEVLSELVQKLIMGSSVRGVSIMDELTEKQLLHIDRLLSSLSAVANDREMDMLRGQIDAEAVSDLGNDAEPVMAIGATLQAVGEFFNDPANAEILSDIGTALSPQQAGKRSVIGASHTLGDRAYSIIRIRQEAPDPLPTKGPVWEDYFNPYQVLAGSLGLSIPLGGTGGALAYWYSLSTGAKAAVAARMALRGFSVVGLLAALGNGTYNYLSAVSDFNSAVMDYCYEEWSRHTASNMRIAEGSEEPVYQYDLSMCGQYGIVRAGVLR